MSDGAGLQKMFAKASGWAAAFGLRQPLLRQLAKSIAVLYCNAIVRRWQLSTGKKATLAATGQAFEDVAEERLGPSLDSEAA